MSFVDDMNTVMDTLRDEALVSAYDIIKDADAKIAELQAEVEKSRSQPDRQCALQELAKSQQRVREFEALVPSSTDPLETLRKAVDVSTFFNSNPTMRGVPSKVAGHWLSQANDVASAAKKEPSNG